MGIFHDFSQNRVVFIGNGQVARIRLGLDEGVDDGGVFIIGEFLGRKVEFATVPASVPCGCYGFARSMCRLLVGWLGVTKHYGESKDQVV